MWWKDVAAAARDGRGVGEGGAMPLIKRRHHPPPTPYNHCHTGESKGDTPPAAGQGVEGGYVSVVGEGWGLCHSY